MRTVDCVSGLHNCREFSQLPLVFRWGYGNTENVLYCLIMHWSMYFCTSNYRFWITKQKPHTTELTAAVGLEFASWLFPTISISSASIVLSESDSGRAIRDWTSTRDNSVSEPWSTHEPCPEEGGQFYSKHLTCRKVWEYKSYSIPVTTFTLFCFRQSRRPERKGKNWI